MIFVLIVRLPLQKKSLLFGRLTAAEVSNCFPTDIARVQNIADISYCPSTPLISFDTSIKIPTMSSKTADERITGLEGNVAKMMEAIERWSLCFDGPMFGSPKSEDVNVLPSVSNPASETSPLSDRKHNLPPVPPTKSHTVSSRIKPANPSEFSGDRTKGCAFLNSCNLYFALTPHQFADDHAKIMWVFSFMKNKRAAHFVDRNMRMYNVVGSLTYATWQEFVLEFVTQFCPRTKSRRHEPTSRLQPTSKGHAPSTSMSIVSGRLWRRPATSRVHTLSSNFVRASIQGFRTTLPASRKDAPLTKFPNSGMMPRSSATKIASRMPSSHPPHELRVSPIHCRQQVVFFGSQPRHLRGRTQSAHRVRSLYQVSLVRNAPRTPRPSCVSDVANLDTYDPIA
jgi:hypothetical protein